MLHGETLCIVGGKRQEVTQSWRKYRLIEKGYEARCVEVKWKRRRRVLVQLRSGIAALEVEKGRWRGVSREGRLCRNCRSEEVEV